MISAGVTRLLILSLIFIAGPLATLYIVQSKLNLDYSQDLSPTARVLISGLSAVVVVHIVIALFLYNLFKYMRKND